MHELWIKTGIRQIRSSVYHPQSNGPVERANRSIKEAMRILVNQNSSQWDDEIPYLLFALRESPCRTTGFSPFELLYGRHVRGPLEIIREVWEDTLDEDSNPKGTIEYVLDMRSRLDSMLDIAKTSAEEIQMKQKQAYDLKSRLRNLHPGQKVLVLLPVETKLDLAWQGPFRVLKRISAVNYVVELQSKKMDHRTYHINLLKEYVERAPHLIAHISTSDMDEAEIPELHTASVKDDKHIEEEQGETELAQQKIILSDETFTKLPPDRSSHYVTSLTKEETEQLPEQKTIREVSHDTPHSSSEVISTLPDPLKKAPPEENIRNQEEDVAVHAMNAPLFTTHTHHPRLQQANHHHTRCQQRSHFRKRELLAIPHGLTKYRSDIIGTPFTVYSDHKPLRYLSSMSQHNPRLSQYDMTIRHRAGVNIPHADALSRIELNE